MTKETTTFPSFWGDMTVKADSITQSDKSDKDDKKDNEKDKVDEDHTTVAGEADHEGDGVPAGGEGADSEGDDDDSSTDGQGDTGASSESKEGEGGEDSYEYSEDDVAKAYGILEEEGILELGDDDEFEASPKGLADAVAATVRNKVAEEFKAIPPVVQEFYNHVKEGKDISSFTQSAMPTDWAKLDTSEESAQNKVLAELYTHQGMTPEEAREEIESIPEDKKARKVELAQGVLSRRDAKQAEAQKKAAEKAAEDAKKAAKKDIEALSEKIDSIDEIAGFKFGADKKKEFKDYLFKVNPRTGKTQLQENMSKEDRRLTIAALDFINYTKADLEKEVATKLTKDRKKKLSRYTDKNVKNRSASTVKQNVDTNKGVKKFPTIFGSSTIEVED